MPRVRKYDPSLLEISVAGHNPSSWTFAGKPVSGTEHVYLVEDRNFTKAYRWEFVVRVPAQRGELIEVRPRLVPPLQIWAGLDRRSLTFNRANKQPHVGSYYCQVALADPTGERTKDVVHKNERQSLPKWFDAFERQIKLKETVHGTSASDGHSLVVLADPADHRSMIRLFFATKVWILKEKIVLEA